MMLRFPCADCGRPLAALAVPSAYLCPCGATYTAHEHTCEGTPGLVLIRDRAAPLPPIPGCCTACGAPCSRAPVPSLALFLSAVLGLRLVDVVNSECPACGTSLETPIDPEAVPHWRALATTCAET